ncbi:PREDICTED: protein DA1-related 2-like isoform X2 [Tarenaya hassleriana]|uniref:protein DA1-related 2-like isoform X2 n=1 Tax=Tarenaya hassleriana TaxID=28532 RepID=UPI00053C0CC5|nr:PREDICTED: protein DA1-related 2-like isoform X2 [Tarenaya hassleriana]
MDSSSSGNGDRINHISNPCIFGDVGSSSSSSIYREKKWRLMKWLSKIFKGSGSSSSSCHGGGVRARESDNHLPQFQEDENMVFRLPPRSLDGRSRAARDKEELDRSFPLSLEDDIMKRPHGYGHDQDFPRPFRGGLNPSFVPPYESSHQYRQRHRICGGCHGDIGHGNYLGCMGTFFHPECFRCHSCGYPITEHEFSLSGKKPYHKLCLKEMTHPKCEVCHQFIPTNDAGLIEYRCHPFWNQKYCPSHEYDNTARCCSCERLESREVKYYTLEDGRSLCLECMETAIMDTGDCQPLYHAIRDYYEGMNMKLDQQIPMLLVQREALNEAIVGEKNGYHHMPETRGLCLSEEQTVSSVLRRPRLGGHRLVGMRTQPQKLTRKCEVTAILVLYGLPRLLTGAILAHELMHGWLRLKGYRNLNPEVEEGICQVLSYMWLESEVISDPSSRNLPSTSSSSFSSSCKKAGGKSNMEKKLGEFFKYQIVHDVSPAYGGGFRAANSAVSKYGLRRTLDHIRLTGTFPL